MRYLIKNPHSLESAEGKEFTHNKHLVLTINRVSILVYEKRQVGKKITKDGKIYK